MIPRVVSAELVDGYRVRLSFSDGATGVIDFRDRIVGRGGVFEALEDPDVFAGFRIDKRGNRFSGEDLRNRSKKHARIGFAAGD